ncbi:MAG: hypothetical protein JWO97_3446 [Acidobacteria bacterium]|nr:hypothetical protein [Acidobacteriota bacterium]
MLTAVLLFASACATTQPPTPTPTPKAKTAEGQKLYDEIARMDTAMGDAFNAHDLDRLMALFSEDLEFYHDAGGLQSHRDVTNGFRNLFSRNDGLHRELVPGSLEVYPIHGYGAIEVGAHRFCHKENGRDDCGTFKFMEVWRQNAGTWKMTRVISYDH